ncbi:MAG: type I-C CRISPR-associated protein Cas8c/Csd1, partial [Limisphaerales bacterium]
DYYTMTEKLDPKSKDRAYLCGQLFAVLGRLQLLALGKVGASIAERTYGGVATRPATTLGPLFTKVPAYLKKANDRFPGAGTNKQKEIESLCQSIEAQGGLKQTLDLEEQARFALGYYCQLAEYRARREEIELEQKAEQLAEESV